MRRQEHLIESGQRSRVRFLCKYIQPRCLYDSILQGGYQCSFIYELTSRRIKHNHAGSHSFKGLSIKQSYERVGRQLVMKASRYAHARQMKRAKACTRKLKTNLGRVIREIERQSPVPAMSRAVLKGQVKNELTEAIFPANR